MELANTKYPNMRGSSQMRQSNATGPLQAYKALVCVSIYIYIYIYKICYF